MDILITGITGFVGSHLADYLLTKNDVCVHGICRWRSPKDNILHCIDDINLHHCDLCDYISVVKCIEAVKPDIIFHLAAQSLVPYSFDVPLETLRVNVIGSCHLLESVKYLKLATGYNPIIMWCSSSEVYGQVKEEELPIMEEQPFRPASPYAVSKAAEDMLGYQYWLSYDLNIIRARMFSHTGKRRGEFFAVSNFAKQIADIEIKGKEPVIYVGNLNSVRTFADVRDTVRAYWLLVNKCTPGEVYNIGGSVTMTVGEMLDKLIGFSTIKGIKIQVDSDRLRPSDVTLQIPSIEKFKLATGWQPEISFEKTLRDILEYWRHKERTIA